jgi:hydrogenase-4 component B
MLAGSVAIAGLPPFNGFVSEWLTFQAVLASPLLPQPSLRLGIPVIGVLLALAAALAAVCFVRVFGIVFLGRPRSPEAAAAHAPEPALTRPLLALGAGCLLLGLVPALGFALTDPVLRALGQPAFAGASGWFTIQSDGRGAAYGGLALAVTAGLLGAILMIALRRWSPAVERRGAPWDCGFPDASPTTQYTASSFSQPLRRVAGPLFRVREHVDMPTPLDGRAARFSVSLSDPLWIALYRPPARLVDALAGRLNIVQYLTIRRYLSLTFGVLVLLMILVTVGA